MGISLITVLEEIANPTPLNKPPVFIPMTCPLVFNNGPPELPGFIDASV